MSHPFGNLIRQHLSRKHGLSQNKLADGVEQDPSVISRMCRGQRLTGPGARQRVLRIIGWLHEQEVLFHQEEANALLRAAGLAELSPDNPADAPLIQRLIPRAEPPPASSSTTPRPFLAPRQPDYRLVGRDRVLRWLKDRLFANSAIALCALNGLPGVGKTALAIALAHDREVQTHFPDGVLWAALGREPDVLAILGDWALALGFHSEEITRRNTIRSRQSLLRTALGRKRALLVVDDAWQSEAALSFKIGGPLCAHLVTTRQPAIALDFAGEGMTRVSELEIEEGLSLLTGLASAAVAAEPAAARELVTAVGGLPLAIVLMGHYLRKEVESNQPRRLHQALDRLHRTEERLRLAQPPALIGETPAYPDDVPLSLRAAIALSAEALEAEAHQALLALALFPPKPNTFSEEAALAVIGGQGRLLDALYDAGLLESMGVGRYTLHQTIADYGRTMPADPAAGERLVAYFVGYTEAHEHDHDLLAQELENILAALRLAFERGLYPEAVRGVNALAHFLETSGLYAVAETYLHRARDAARAVDDRPGLAMILLHLGRIKLWRGDYTQAEEDFRQGLAQVQQDEQPVVQSFLLSNLGWLVMHRGEYDRAETYYRQALSLAQQNDHQERISALLSNLGVLEHQRGNDARAADLFRQSLVIARQLDHRERISDLLLNLGALAQQRGDYAQADELYQESLAIAQELGHRENICLLWINLGTVAWHRGKIDQAERYHRASLRLAREIESNWLLCNALLEWSDFLFEQGRQKPSEIALREAIRLAQETELQDLAEQAQDKMRRFSQLEFQ